MGGGIKFIFLQIWEKRGRKARKETIY